jgi:hypothetical protein
MMGLRDLAMARLAKLNAQATECPGGTVPRACPSGTPTSIPVCGTDGTLGTPGTLGTTGTADIILTDTPEERAAIVEYDGGAPREWAEAFARLDRAQPPGDVPARRWRQFIDDCGAFMDGDWPVQAAALGWDGGGRLTYRRVPDGSGQVLVWELN